MWTRNSKCVSCGKHKNARPSDNCIEEAHAISYEDHLSSKNRWRKRSTEAQEKQRQYQHAYDVSSKGRLRARIYKRRYRASRKESR